MKASDLIRHALIAGAAFPGGCAGSQPPIAAPSAMPQSGALSPDSSNARFMRASEALYGTTSEGGDRGGGTVFVIEQSGQEHVLHKISVARETVCVRSTL